MFPRLSRKQREEPLPAATAEDHFAEIIETLPAAEATSALPAGRFGRALAYLLRRSQIAHLDELGLIARLSKQASDTTVNVIWISHDVHEMTRSARAISGAVEELATSIDAIAENSVESAALAASMTASASSAG